MEIDFDMPKSLGLSSITRTFNKEIAVSETKFHRGSLRSGQKMESEGWYLRPRFSPGYGDFSLNHQTEIISVLQCPKKIGLTLTDSLLMAPAKSVTAVIGLSRIKQPCHRHGCEVCEKKRLRFSQIGEKGDFHDDKRKAWKGTNIF